VAPTDLVLHRVVCCYPDYQRLLAAAADHTGAP
jgi:magnesium-protoporphyrin O-methyltransferase